jgi:hypothetical protein
MIAVLSLVSTAALVAGQAKGFKTKAGSGYIWHTWKRVK